MTEPRKLPRGQNQRTALVDAARSFIGTSDPRNDGARIVGDPVDAVLGAAVDGIGAEHERRQYRRGFHGLVESAARRPAVTASNSEPVDEESVARAKAEHILEGLSPAERDAVRDRS